jgi:hypothetical protein
LLVSCADKLHNARAILQDFRAVGHRIWKRFTKKGDKTPEGLVGLYDTLAEAFQNRLPGSIANELGKTVDQLKGESGLKPDRGWERSI